MKTFYVLLWMVCALTLAVILTSSMPYLYQMVFFCIVLGLTYRESRLFAVKNIMTQNNKILLTDKEACYEVNFLPSSVVGRHVCFLHLSETGTGKRWYIPVSRLEFSKEVFRELKCTLQYFLMKKLPN